MRRAVYAGTFDPITNGHLDITERSAQLFDEVIVAVAIDNYKKPLFATQERVQLIRDSVRNLPNVRVESFAGLLVSSCLQQQAHTIIRGLRAVSDFDKELQMALLNRQLEPQIDTVFMMSKAEFLFISSSTVRNAAALGACVADMVPPHVARALTAKYQSLGALPQDISSI